MNSGQKLTKVYIVRKKNIIYLLGCKKCQTQYVGESNTRSLQSRFSEHQGYVKNQKINKATGEHFNRKGHTISDMEITIVEKLQRNSEYLENKERKCSSQNSTQNIGA